MNDGGFGSEIVMLASSVCDECLAIFRSAPNLTVANVG